MKNIITTATLLAAGTLAMNAAVTTWDSVPATAVSGTSQGIWSVEDVGLKLNSINPWSVVFTIDKNALSDKDLTLLSMDFTPVEQGYQYILNGFTGIKYNAADSSKFEIMCAGTNRPETSGLTLNASKDYTFVYSKVAQSSNILTFTLTVYADGNFNSSVGTVSLFQSRKYYTLKAPTVLRFGGFVSDYSSKKYTANDKVGEFTLLGAGYTVRAQITTDELKSYYSSAVPEPSAFGLLAGLGALALVGARRRRH